MRSLLLLFFTVVMFSGCSMDRFVIRQTAALLDYGVLALYEETDLILAEQALASDIKLLEGMIKGDPENNHILLLTSQALSGYALGFAEDETPERAKPLYLRARDYGLRVLRENELFAQNEKKPLEEFTRSMSGFESEDLDGLFWTAFAWAGWINLSLDNPRAFIDLPKVQAMMQRVLDLDPSFFYGSAHLFFGSVWGTKPRMMGGDPDKAKEHFEKNLVITGGKFLLTYIYYARYYAVKTLNEDLFDQLISKVESTPVDVLPGYQLLNAIAKQKAMNLKSARDEFF